ncbi:MAG: integration host factor, actinobacterial type [Actinomycetota bacterium]|nr:integration host factor, actinobacterial type [Actinomycetota bacterium]MDI6821995.1 integration host factor, actinobacterial type [Actinomycetota bacterium]
MPLPRLSDAERRAALRKAGVIRQQRAQLKRKLKQGETTLVEILNKSSDPVVARMKVSSLIESLPKVGKARSQKIMKEIGISASRRVQGLGSKQRERLINMLT